MNVPLLFPDDMPRDNLFSFEYELPLYEMPDMYFVQRSSVSLN